MVSLQERPTTVLSVPDLAESVIRPGDKCAFDHEGRGFSREDGSALSVPEIKHCSVGAGHGIGFGQRNVSHGLADGFPCSLALASEVGALTGRIGADHREARLVIETTVSDAGRNERHIACLDRKDGTVGPTELDDRAAPGNTPTTSWASAW